MSPTGFRRIIKVTNKPFLFEYMLSVAIKPSNCFECRHFVSPECEALVLPVHSRETRCISRDGGNLHLSGTVRSPKLITLE